MDEEQDHLKQLTNIEKAYSIININYFLLIKENILFIKRREYMALLEDISVQLRNQAKALEEAQVPINTIPKLQDFAKEKNIEHWRKIETFLKKLQLSNQK
ncbi:uncharacterized protein T551_00533 [Pneumocystis jirovecii RU7]|uniref:Uncharacterized protein n=1 Tax=Pneumocystis jirovecii (strain RU7) TaxID=1408657 RepID=A0A0W4ZVP3_PNEJ7|nr:uncharacterized protein T551_00533 [Pneumocystis jirovecii RU7]KTW32443.1 hypothetical protein T551_00533 [Pneumocystis jirovecii RU7]